MSIQPTQERCPEAPGSGDNSTHHMVAPPAGGIQTCRYCNRSALELKLAATLSAAGLVVLAPREPYGTPGIKVARMKDTAMLMLAAPDELTLTGLRRDAESALVSAGYVVARAERPELLYVGTA